MALAVLGLGLAVTSGASATEDGVSVYPNGPALSVIGALPPPGDYIGMTTSVYTADRANSSAGDRATPPDFRLTAVTGLVRYIHVTSWRLFGADWGMHAIVPVTSLDETAAGTTRRMLGIANIVVSPLMLGWHAGNWHWLAGFDINMPDFNWRPGRLNVGQGYWNVEPFAASAIGITAAGRFRSRRCTISISRIRGPGTGPGTSFI